MVYVFLQVCMLLIPSLMFIRHHVNHALPFFPPDTKEAAPEWNENLRRLCEMWPKPIKPIKTSYQWKMTDCKWFKIIQVYQIQIIKFITCPCLDSVATFILPAVACCRLPKFWAGPQDFRSLPMWIQRFIIYGYLRASLIIISLTIIRLNLIRVLHVFPFPRDIRHPALIRTFHRAPSRDFPLFQGLTCLNLFRPTD